MVQCANLRKIRQKWSRSHNIHTKNKLIKKKKENEVLPDRCHSRSSGTAACPRHHTAYTRSRSTKHSAQLTSQEKIPVIRIRIRNFFPDRELFVSEPDPARMKEQIN